jgi:hypothetical protein
MKLKLKLGLLAYTVFLLLLFHAPVARAAATLINLATQVMGILPVANGGTNQAAVPGTTGQLIFNNGGAYGAEDPIVSYNYVNLFSAVNAHVTETSSNARVSTFGQGGTLITTWASITGSPATCTIQINSLDSLGNIVANGSAISVTPTNGTTSATFSPASGVATAAQMQAVYNCGTFPTAGTLSLDFVPALPVWFVGSQVANQSTNTAQVGGTNYALGSAAMAASQPIVEATNQGNPCSNPNATPTAFNVTTSGTSLTQLIALSAGKQIFVCSIVLTSVSGTTPNYELEYGTATNCGSGTNVLVGPSATVTAGTIINYQQAFIVPASNALCYKMGVTTPVFNLSGWYVQQ